MRSMMGIFKTYLKKKMTIKKANTIQIFVSMRCTITGLISGAIGTRNKYTTRKNTSVNRVISRRVLGSFQKSRDQRKNHPNKLL